jgi:hypothetical protein
VLIDVTADASALYFASIRTSEGDVSVSYPIKLPRETLRHALTRVFGTPAECGSAKRIAELEGATAALREQLERAERVTAKERKHADGLSAENDTLRAELNYTIGRNRTLKDELAKIEADLQASKAETFAARERLRIVEGARNRGTSRWLDQQIANLISAKV